MGSVNINLGMFFETKSKDYKFKDIALPFTVSLNRDFEEIKDIASVQNGIANIFQWRKGQRVLEPEFGTNIYQLLYEPINTSTATLIGEYLKTDLERWEPRIKIDKLIIDPREEENTYYIQVNYSVPALTNQILVFNAAITRN